MFDEKKLLDKFISDHFIMDEKKLFYYYSSKSEVGSG
jgi:hypothetical protein